MYADQVDDLYKGLTKEEQAFIKWQTKWADTARANQIPPEADWSEYGVMSGRGWGKTKAGAEWLGRLAYEDPHGLDKHVVAPTYNDVTFTCFEGDSGLLSIIPPELIVGSNRSDYTITVRNISGGETLIRGFSAERPDRLRGPQCSAVWADEVAAWQRADETWDNLLLGLRLGLHPQLMWTTTPRPRTIVRRLTKATPGRIIVGGSTYDNAANLAPSFFTTIQQYEGTTIGRQELHGELIDIEEMGVIKRSWLRLWPHDKMLPKFDLIVMSLDTAFTEKTVDDKTYDPDYSACIVLGSFRVKDEQHAMFLDCWQEQLGLPDLLKRVKKELNVRYGDDEDIAVIRPMFGSAKPLTSGRKPDLLIIEDKGSGISLRQSLVAHGIYAHAYNPGNADKLSRLHMVSPVFARGRIWLPESEKLPGKPKTWLEPMLAQLCAYAGAGSIKHDDFVDATSQAVRVMVDKSMLSVVKPPKKKPEDDAAPPREKVTNPYAQ